MDKTPRKRGRGADDVNVTAFDTVMRATGQKPKAGLPKAKKAGVSLGSLATKSKA